MLHLSQTHAHFDSRGTRNSTNTNKCDPHDTIGCVEDRHLRLTQFRSHCSDHRDTPKVRSTSQSRREVQRGKGPDAFPCNLGPAPTTPTGFMQPLNANVNKVKDGQLDVNHGHGDDRTCMKTIAVPSRYRNSQNKEETTGEVEHESQRCGVHRRVHDALCREELLQLTKDDEPRNRKGDSSGKISRVLGYLWIRPESDPHSFGAVPCDENKNGNKTEDKVGYLQVYSG
mmetsp:Transcript_2544/g.3457  ORF Transcript_2544/g.3457 Transcript_2544/m.3457 type:complete len:228 (+) Transcript_2544:689-1372(+)